MATTWELIETFDGTREQSMPDPDNDGETKTETITGVTDIKVKFTCDDVDPSVEHERFVNVCFDADGEYDADATAVRIGEVANGVGNKVAIGVIA